MHKRKTVNTARELLDTLDDQLKSIANSFAGLFQREYGAVTAADELQTFMETYDAIIGRQIADATQQSLLIATSEGIDNINLLIEEIRNAKAKTISYLWRQIAGMRRPSAFVS